MARCHVGRVCRGTPTARWESLDWRVTSPPRWHPEHALLTFSVSQKKDALVHWGIQIPQRTRGYFGGTLSVTLGLFCRFPLSMCFHPNVLHIFTKFAVQIRESSGSSPVCIRMEAFKSCDYGVIYSMNPVPLHLVKFTFYQCTTLYFSTLLKQA